MAYSRDSSTCMFLNEISQFFNISPFEFLDLDINTTCNPTERIKSVCDQISQYNYQGSGNIDIETFAYYLQMAEELVQQHVSFSICGGYSTETVELPRHYRPEIGYKYGPYANWGTGTKIITKTKCIKELGVPVYERLAFSELITKYGSMDDIYLERFRTVFQLPLNFDHNEFENLYITLPGQSGNTQYKVPVTVESYNRDTRQLIVTGQRWDIIKLDIVLNESTLRRRSHDLCDESIYENILELWVLRSNKCVPYAYMVCDTPCKSCQRTKIPVCLDILDCDAGVLEIKSYGSVDENGCFVEGGCVCAGSCNRIEISMRSGCGCGCGSDIHQNKAGCKLGDTICPTLKRPILMLLAALLPKWECNCANVIQLLEYYQNDFAFKPSGGGSYSMPFGMLEQPFGSERGAVLAYKAIQEIETNRCGGGTFWTTNRR